MRFRYTRHAVQRMAERGLGVEKVEDIIQSGTIIARYEDDRPFPSCLILGFDAGKPWHIVYSAEGSGPDAVVHVVTVYQPDPLEWNYTFTERKART